MRDSPKQSVLVYDGACAFCLAQVNRIRRWDRWDRFEYVARQTPGLGQRFPVLNSSDFDTGMRLITPDGTVLVGADAAHGVVRRLPGWRRLAWLYKVPPIHEVCRWAYGRVAAKRYALAGRCESHGCDVRAHSS